MKYGPSYIEQGPYIVIKAMHDTHVIENIVLVIMMVRVVAYVNCSSTTWHECDEE